MKTTTGVSFNDTGAKNGVYYKYKIKAVSGSYASAMKETGKYKR